ncbi:MAG: M14 family metallopeptidase [Alphaproteobacteria bacterium]|nr:M14 family metallopeptidase [Alphaproteobacteria bacterium]
MKIKKAASNRFPSSYAVSRESFIEACKAAGASHKSYQNPNRGPTGEKLTADAAWIGKSTAKKLLVLVSGTHGVEGFCGAGALIDFLGEAFYTDLPKDTAVLLVHAINPHGYAWLRRVTEENVDLNRNFVDFEQPLPINTGYDELADAFIPPALSGPEFDQAEAKIQAYIDTHGFASLQSARSGGQYRYPQGIFFGGHAPTWARRTLERMLDDFDLPKRKVVGVIDFHTALGPYGYGEPICGHAPGSKGVKRAKRWYGDSVTEPALGTSSSVPKVGLAEFGWEWACKDRVTHIALEFGTYPPPVVRAALRDDHWLHSYTNLDWDDPETQQIKARVRKAYFPDNQDWREMVIFRSRQIVEQAMVGLGNEKI